MDYRYATEKRDYGRIDKLNKLTNIDTFWDDVRKLTKNISSDHTIRLWQGLAEIRYEELEKESKRPKTRFQKEISGELGSYWQESARKEVKDLMDSVKENIVFEKDGAIRWKTGNYVPEDVCEKLKYGGLKFNESSTAKKRERQVHQQIENYRRNQANRKISDEELYEMRSAFGKGTEVVDVITGKKIKL